MRDVRKGVAKIRKAAEAVDPALARKGPPDAAVLQNAADGVLLLAKAAEEADKAPGLKAAGVPKMAPVLKDLANNTALLTLLVIGVALGVAAAEGGSEKRKRGSGTDPKIRPPQKPNVDNWEKKGGKVTKHRDGSVTYTDWENHKVTYNAEGYPNFKKAGFVKAEVEIDMKPNRTTDFNDADKELVRLIGRKRDTNNETWHHNEDGKTMQLIDREIHRRFHHSGGFSKLLQD